MTAPALQTYVQGQSAVSADNLNTFQQTCDSYAQLRALIGIIGMQVYTRGTVDPNDGGQANWYWDITSSALDNNSNVLKPVGGASTGRWIKLDDSALTLLAACNGSTLVGYERTGISFPACRTVQLKNQDIADLRDWNDIDYSGNNDNFATLQSAINSCAAIGAPLDIPGTPTTLIACGSPLVLPGGTILRGVLKAGETSNTYSCFLFTGSGDGFQILDSGGPRSITNINTMRVQPPSTSGWVPNALGWDINIRGGREVYLDSIHLFNPTNGIQLTCDATETFPCGRVHIERISGRPFSIGVQAQYVEDVFWMDDVEFWPFNQNDANLNAYCQTFGVAFRFGRVDNPQFGRVFALGYDKTVEVYQSPDIGAVPGGTISLMDFDQLGCDSTHCGVLIRSSTVYATANITSMYATGVNDGVISIALVQNNGQNSQLSIDNLDLAIAPSVSIRTGQGAFSRTDVGNLHLNRSSQVATGAVVTASTNSTTLLTVTSVTSGIIGEGAPVSSAGIPAGTYISTFGTGTGGVGTYNMSANATATASGVTVTVAPSPAVLTDINAYTKIANLIKDHQFSQPTTRPTWIGGVGPTSVGVRMSGETLMTASTTTKVVNHGLPYAPSIEDISVTPLSGLAGGISWWVASVTDTQFTITVNAAPSVDITFNWQAALERGNPW